MIRQLILVSCLCFGLVLPSFGAAQSQPAPLTPAASGGVGPKEPVLDAVDILARKINIAERRAKIFKITSLVLSSAGALGGVGAVLSGKVINDPDIQSAVASLGGLSSAISSSLGLIFHFEARAGKNTDCLAYLRTQTSQFTNKWTNGVPPERAAEFEADKDKIENGDSGKCTRLELH